MADFPDPVGWTTRVSCPSIIDRTASSCPGRSDSKPNLSRATFSIWALVIFLVGMSGFGVCKRRYKANVPLRAIWSQLPAAVQWKSACSNAGVQVLRTLSPLARWIVIGCAATLCVLAVFAVIFAIKFPFKESSVVQMLQRESSGVVHIAGFKRVYFPPGFVADGVIITLPGVQGPPLINVGHAKVTATYAGLLRKPQRISSLRLEHFIVHIPDSAPATSRNNKSSGDDVIIEHVNADHARLEFGNDAVFNIHHLALSNVATTRQITFDA